MIHYDLVCDSGHAFDGWFPDSAAFESQVERDLVSCPTCGSTAVRRGLMAPAIGRAREAAPMPDALRAQLQRLRAEVEQRCEYVGGTFAEQARRIHDGEAPVRPIYGEATDDEARSLAEDGVSFARIPWVAPADS